MQWSEKLQVGEDAEHTVELEGVFVQIGLVPNSEWLKDSGLELSPRGEYELTDAIKAMVQDGKHVGAVELQGDWADVRDPETLEELNKA